MKVEGEGVSLARVKVEGEGEGRRDALHQTRDDDAHQCARLGRQAAGARARAPQHGRHRVVTRAEDTTRIQYTRAEETTLGQDGSQHGAPEIKSRDKQRTGSVSKFQVRYIHGRQQTGYTNSIY